MSNDMPKEVYASNDLGNKFWTRDEHLVLGKQTKYTRSDLVTQWQPIETAPRDGTYILLYRPSKDGRHKDSVREGKCHRYGVRDTWRVRSGGVWDIDAPTHWMPLPKPPMEE